MFAATAVFLCLASAVLSAPQSQDPSCDHQTKTYTATHKPSYCSSPCSVTPFFSPDHSIDTYVKLIEEAEESIDLFTPGEKDRQRANLARYIDKWCRRPLCLYVFALFYCRF